MVAIPVQEMESTPGPKYSTMAPVPPLTVKMSATLRIISLGVVQPPSFPIQKIHITPNYQDFFEFFLKLVTIMFDQI